MQLDVYRSMVSLTRVKILGNCDSAIYFVEITFALSSSTKKPRHFFSGFAVDNFGSFRLNQGPHLYKDLLHLSLVSLGNFCTALSITTELKAPLYGSTVSHV